MSTVHVFVGQCGTQLGTSFLDELVQETECTNSNLFQELVSSRHFRPAVQQGKAVHKYKHYLHNGNRMLPEPRCVMVDMEPKVIEEAVKRVNGYTWNNSTNGYYNCHFSDRKDKEELEEKYRENEEWNEYNCDEQSHSMHHINNTMCNAEAHNVSSMSDSAHEYVHTNRYSNSISGYSYTLSPLQCVTRGEGSGNNWAYGYYVQGESRREAILECLRRESEWSDYGMSCVHVLHAIAGGTGSGVGSLVAEVVKDNFPSSLLMHSLVWPFATGEVATQWYNLILSMQSLHECVDGACILYNDEARQRIMNKLATRGLQQTAWVDYDSMNKLFSQLLTPLHLPQERRAIPSCFKFLNQGRSSGNQYDHDGHDSSSSNHKKINLRYRMSNSTNYDQCEEHSFSRLARMSDVIEATSLDPLGKFFCAKSVPETDLGGMSWTAIVNSAARVATLFHTSLSRSIRNVLSLWPNSFHSCRATHVQGEEYITPNVTPWQYCHRRCLWTLRGPGAESDGLNELHRLCSEYANEHHQPLTLETENTSHLSLSSSREFTSTATTTTTTLSALNYAALPFPLTALFVRPWNAMVQEGSVTSSLNDNEAACVDDHGNVNLIQWRLKQRVKSAESGKGESGQCNRVSYREKSIKSKEVHAVSSQLPSSSTISLAQSSTNARDVARERRSVSIVRPTREVVLYGPMEQIGEQCVYALRKAEKLLHVNAYLHHYDRYGVSKDDLLDACATLWDVAANYTDVDSIPEYTES